MFTFISVKASRYILVPSFFMVRLKTVHLILTILCHIPYTVDSAKSGNEQRTLHICVFTELRKYQRYFLALKHTQGSELERTEKAMREFV